MSDKKKNFLDKFAGKGYYIALVLCAVAIGISGYLYYSNIGKEDTSLQGPEATVDALNPGEGTLATQPVGVLPTDPSKPTPKPLKTGKPVAGDLGIDYAVDCLCYNPTTRDWRIHDGMDYAAAAGTQVTAAADGTVYTIYQDDTMGTTVVIRHQDGYVTTYASLDPNVAVSVGQAVSLGQTIGYVGVGAMLETALGEHVHFSVTCNGVSVDPETFFALN